MTSVGAASAGAMEGALAGGVVASGVDTGSSVVSAWACAFAAAFCCALFSARAARAAFFRADFVGLLGSGALLVLVRQAPRQSRVIRTTHLCAGSESTCSEISSSDSSPESTGSAENTVLVPKWFDMTDCTE